MFRSRFGIVETAARGFDLRTMRKTHLKFVRILPALFATTWAGEDSAKARYVFLFVGDGMGSAQVALAEAYRASVEGDPVGFVPTSFSRFPVRADVTTHCAVRRTTESAAAGTAIASGSKAGEAAIGVDVSGKALRTLAEEARDAGVPVGILTTVPVNHATPAAFYAHAPNRNDYWEIGRQLADSRMSLFAGGDFQEPGGRKGESREDLREIAKKKGFRVVRGRDSIVANTTLPAILFGLDPNAAALPWEMDSSDARTPVLADYVASAIRLLDGPKGFFVMAEAGKIDWAGHANDARANIDEVWGLDQAVKVALEFASRHPRQTLILVTADHETGGLSLGNGPSGYATEFALLRHQKSSKDRLEDLLAPIAASIETAKTAGDTAKVVSQVFARIATETGLGRVPELALAATDSVEILESLRARWGIAKAGTKSGYGATGSPAATAIRILNRKAGVGWTSGAHTAIPVPLYAKGVGQERFGGRLDNTDIPRILRELVEWRTTRCSP